VGWNARESLTEPDDGQAGWYLQLLRMLHERRSTIWLVELLAAETGTCSFARPDEIRGRLRSLDAPFVAWREVVSGHGDRTTVRDLLERDQLTNLPSSAVQDLVRFLLQEGHVSDLAALERYWSDDQFLAPLCGRP
jgi:hypothetical protein